MGITLTDVLLFGKAQSDDVDNATLVIYRRNILRWGAIGGYVDVIVKGVSPLVLPDAIENSLQYVKAYGGTEQRNIPAEYTQVKYVTNSASTMLNTGITFNFAKNYVLELRARAVGSSWYMFQSRKSTAPATNQINGISGSSTNTTISANFNGVQATSNISRTVGNIVYVKMIAENGTLTLYVKDETAGTEDTVTDTYTVENVDALSSIRLWGNEAGGNAGINSDVYMARIIEDGVTVVDYIPCRQGVTAGFYDTVTDSFKTTSDIVADGNAVPTPDTPMNFVCNNGMLKARRESGLPLNYQKVTWVRVQEAVDFGIYTTQDTKITTRFYRENNTAQYLYVSDSGSALTTNTTAYLTSGNGNWRFGNRSVTLNVPTDTLVTFVQDKTGVYKTEPSTDSWDYSTVNDFTSENTLRTGAYADSGNIRYYSMVVEKNDVKVLDLIPVRRLSDNKVGFYNLVNGDFFEATGNATIGADISDPVELYADGITETITCGSPNLFDASTVPDDNKYININNGNTATPSTGTWGHSTYIPVTPNTTYYVGVADSTGSSAGLCWYDESYDNISGTGVSMNTLRSQNHIVTSPAGAKYIRFTFRTDEGYDPDYEDTVYLVRGNQPLSPVVPYYDGGSATCENLFAVGTHSDMQEILAGKVKRNVGIKVLDGTEGWAKTTAWGANSFYISRFDGGSGTVPILCTHNSDYSGSSVTSLSNQCTMRGSSFVMSNSNYTQVAAFESWLVQQYAAGTPVIVLYPLTTQVKETVTAQTLQVQAGDNTLTITQASMDGLELEAKYHAGVSLTVQEVEDANLDPNVEVTIN